MTVMIGSQYEKVYTVNVKMFTFLLEKFLLH